MLTRIFALHSLHSFKYPIGSSFLKPFILKNIFHFQSTFKMSTTVEVLRVKKLSEHATIPSRASEKAAGYDLVSAYDYTIPAHGKELIKTDIAVAIPDGYYGRVAPRSSLAWKSFIDVGAGVIDADYRGNVGVILFNHSSNDFVVKKGDRVAQLIIEKIATPSVEEVDNLDDTVRGEGGYGSTGSNIADLKTKRAREN